MVELVAHRGYAGRFPENTRLALQRASRLADAVEFDVRRCGSGEAVLLHDETVDRVTGATGPVADCTAAELATLSVLDSGEGVPTLSSALSAVEGAWVNAELKEPVYDALDVLAGFDGRVLVSSFDPDVLAACRDRAPGIDRALLSVTGDAADVELATELDCTAIHPEASAVLDGDVLGRARAADLSVNAWTVRETETADRLRDAGADGLIADYPDV